MISFCFARTHAGSWDGWTDGAKDRRGHVYLREQRDICFGETADKVSAPEGGGGEVEG